MANSISTQEVAETIAATTKQNIPLLGRGRILQKLSSLLVEGNGDVVSVFVPGYGEVTEGPSFAGVESTLDIKVDKVPVPVTIKKQGATYDILEKTLKLNTFESQVKDPYGAKFASYVNTDVFKTIVAAAHSSIVSQTSFNDLAEAVAYVETSRAGNQISGMLSPISKATVIGTGANKFANDRLGEKLYRGEIGEFSGAEFFASPDAGAIRIGAVAAQAWAFAGTLESVSDGDESLGLTVAGTGAAFTLPAGTPIILGSGTAGVAGSISSVANVADVFGNDTGVARTFVVKTATEVTPGTLANVPIAKVSLAGGMAAVPNTYYDGAGTAIPGGPCLCPLFQGTKYYLGAVFADNAVAFASRTPKPFGGTSDSSSFELDGELGVRATLIPGFMSGQDQWRLDVLYGCEPLYGAGAVAVYTQAL